MLTMLKKQRLLDDRYRKAQNQISNELKLKATNELRDWFMGFEMVGYHAILLAEKIIDDCIYNQIQSTDPSAPDVLFSDKDKIERLVTAGKVMADKLDQENKLQELLDELVTQDAQGEGNSI